MRLLLIAALDQVAENQFPATHGTAVLEVVRLTPHVKTITRMLSGCFHMTVRNKECSIFLLQKCIEQIEKRRR